MTVQYSTTHRTNSATQLNTDIGTSALIKFYAGAIPANVAAAAGTVGATLTGNAGGFGTASAGALTASAVTGANASANMLPVTYCRIQTSAAADVVQLTVFQPVTIATSALTAANGNVLTFASTTGVAVGQLIQGTGVLVPSVVIAFTGTTVTMDRASTAGVASAASIKFTGDVEVQNASINSGQALTVSSIVITMNGA